MDIQVRNLVKEYGSQRAVDGISFDIKKGEIVGFLGPNGAGKTTTMKVLTGFLAPSGGEVRIGGHDMVRLPDPAKPLIGYLPENNPLYVEMHVMDYLAYLGELQGLSRAELPQRLRRVVEQCGLGQEKHKKIGALSKGYRQRVGLAQALIHDPAVLILDEPTTGLDPNQIVEIRHLIRELGGEKTVILSSHILSEVEATCDRILIISKGKIVADGKSGALGSMLQGAYELQVQIEAPEGAEVAAALGALPQVRAVLPEGLRYRLSASADLEVRQAIFRLCVERGWILSELSSVEQKLEDLFRKLTLN